MSWSSKSWCRRLKYRIWACSTYKKVIKKKEQSWNTRQKPMSLTENWCSSVKLRRWLGASTVTLVLHRCLRRWKWTGVVTVGFSGSGRRYGYRWGWCSTDEGESSAVSPVRKWGCRLVLWLVGCSGWSLVVGGGWRVRSKKDENKSSRTKIFREFFKESLKLENWGVFLFFVSY